MLAIKTDSNILSELGEKLKRLRLDCNWTRLQLAERSGVPYSTLRRLESTGQGSMRDYLKTLRAVGGLDELTDLIKPPPISPCELQRLRSNKRLRASRSKKNVHT